MKYITPVCEFSQTGLCFLWLKCIYSGAIDFLIKNITLFNKMLDIAVKFLYNLCDKEIIK